MSAIWWRRDVVFFAAAVVLATACLFLALALTQPLLTTAGAQPEETDGGAGLGVPAGSPDPSSPSGPASPGLPSGGSSGSPASDPSGGAAVPDPPPGAPPADPAEQTPPASSGTTNASSHTLPTVTLPTPSPESLERLRALEALAGQISAKQILVYRAVIELDIIDEDLAVTVEEYNLRVMQLEEARQEVTRLQGELDLAREELEVAATLLQDRVVATYKNDNSALEILLGTTDMADFVRRVAFLISIVRSDRDRLDEMTALEARTERLLDDLSREIYEVSTAARRLEEQKTLVEQKLAVRKSYVDQLSAEIKTLVERQRQLGGEVMPVGFDVGMYLAGDGSDVVKSALRYLGVPYVWGGASPAVGFDCSGLVQYVFMQQGVVLPHYSVYQSQMGVEVPIEAIQPADLVFFGNPVHHVGIYMGDGLFIHAPRTGDVVKISRLAARADLSHIRRVAFSSPVAGATIAGETTP